MADTRSSSMSFKSSDQWAQFCFVIIRTLGERVHGQEAKPPTFRMAVKSDYLRTACKEVMGDVTGISWNADPLEVYNHLQSLDEC